MEKSKRARRRTSDTAKSQDGPGASCSTYPGGQRVRSDPESEEMIAEVNVFTTGWVTYYRYAQCKSVLAKLDECLRRKLRCIRLKHCKRTKPIADFLQGNGVPESRAWILALSGKGWWECR